MSPLAQALAAELRRICPQLPGVDRIAEHLEVVAERVMVAEVERLREKADRLSLRVIELENPGIDMDRVRAERGRA